MHYCYCTVVFIIFVLAVLVFVLNGILGIHVPGSCSLGYSVKFLYLHSCMMLLGDAVLVLDCVAWSVGVLLSLCNIFRFV